MGKTTRREGNQKNDLVSLICNFLEVNVGDCTNRDQTVLNVLFCRDFLKLDSRNNYSILPAAAQNGVYPEVILHLQAAPKPWDFFGTGI